MDIPYLGIMTFAGVSIWVLITAFMGFHLVKSYPNCFQHLKKRFGAIDKYFLLDDKHNECVLFFKNHIYLSGRIIRKKDICAIDSYSYRSYLNDQPLEVYLGFGEEEAIIDYQIAAKHMDQDMNHMVDELAKIVGKNNGDVCTYKSVKASKKAHKKNEKKREHNRPTTKFRKIEMN
ncbi:MAG: hypothetical protein K6E54_00655 [Bacteroidaceae bacterium]|nr:hypothetical protein [Bacteroidaceae bacterium]